MGNLSLHGSSSGIIDWTNSMEQTYEFYSVEPDTWTDVNKIDTIKSCSITYDSTADTFMSASIATSEEVNEQYIRVYLVAKQGKNVERIALGTFLVQSPSYSFNGKVFDRTCDAYSPLIELKEKYPPYGYAVQAGTNIIDKVVQLIADNSRCVVINSGTGSDESINRNLFRLKDSVPGLFSTNSNNIQGQTIYKERTTDFIPVTADNAYTIQYWYDRTNPRYSYGVMLVNVYDSNKRYISQPIQDNRINSYVTYTLNIPSNGAYVRVSSRWVEKGYEYAKVKLEKGTTASPWTIAPEDEVNSSDIYSANTTTIDGGKITTGTITANKINVSDLSAISANLGTITAGIIQSNNYVADTSGMKLTLSNGVWDSKNFKIDATGAITSTAGTIGGWTINGGTNRGISCSYTYTPGGSTDTYVDTTTLSGTIPYISMTSSRNDTVYNYTSIEPGELYSYHPGTHDVLILQYGNNSKYGLEARTGQSYIEGEVELTAGMTGEFKYLWRTTASDSNYFKITPSSGGNIDTNLDYVSTGDITGNDITGVNITSSSEITTPFLTVTNTGSTAISCSGGATFGGSLLVGTKKVVIDNYSSGFMAFTNDSASATNVTSSTRCNLASVTLTPGVYIIECVAEWRSNSTTGYRDICLSTSSQGGRIDKYCESTVAPSSAYDRQIFTYTTHITSTTTFYLTAQQNSGGSISTLGGIRALRIGNN